MKVELSLILALVLIGTSSNAWAETAAQHEEAQVSEPQEMAGESPDASDEVIFNSENIGVFEDKENYLLMKAREFFDNEQYAESRKIAEYVIAKLNPDSQEAQDLLAMATEKIGTAIGEMNPLEVKF